MSQLESSTKIVHKKRAGLEGLLDGITIRRRHRVSQNSRIAKIYPQGCLYEYLHYLQNLIFSMSSKYFP